MAPAGGSSKGRRRGRKTNHHHHHHRHQQLNFRSQSKLAKSRSHQNHLSRAIAPLISAVAAAHSFLLRHDLRLSPAQSLHLESLLSSTSRSLSRLFSLLPLPSPPIPPPPPPPPQTWFDTLLSSPESDLRWPQFFNLSKPSFTLLLRLLTPSLSSSSLHPLPPNAALAATLFRLSHAASFSSVARRFSLDSPTACRAFYSVCKAIVENLGHLFEFSSDINRIVVGFGWISLPNCCGVLGIQSFELESPMAAKDSLLVQALVDSEGRFLDVSAGWPGATKPDNVLKRSKLYRGIEESKEYMIGPSYELNSGMSIPQYILGNSCYPLLPWLLTPYSNPNSSSSSSEMVFNRVHRRGIEIAGKAFSKVKKRWNLVAKKWKGQVEAFPFVIVACCLLHNFLIKCSEVFPEDDDEINEGCVVGAYDGDSDEIGMRIRDALALHLARSSQRP
ncbi:protein ALP1-like [Andrographis paniculata]|uniref:protein ALP1-like n=1 Tax=Andrographis paniculata TaxID=175694 RepID=UPI0021E85765|nr:protein ALP1-like [Andrographis paniculata]